MSAGKKTVIFGMDGASPQLLFPWARKGFLPNLAGLIENGRHGILLSTMPPATFPAWSSFMTATNPGKHGLMDFTARVRGEYSVQFVNSTFRRKPTIWKLLNEAGFRVGVLGMPSTYPPEHLDGFMISGFDSPVTTGIEDSFVWPKGLYSNIRKNVGKYLITDFQELHIGPGWHDRAFDGLLRTIERKEKIAGYLLENEEVDVFCILFGESDTVSHHFWCAFDPESPRYSPDLAVKHKNAILEVYRRIDRAIGAILEKFPQDTLVLVVSDHGFGGSGSGVLYLNNWLHRQGHLRFKESGRNLISGLEKVKSGLLGVVPVVVQEQLFRRFGGKIANTLESRLRFGNIDWAGTVAYSEELNYFPSIWLNTRGREPEGIVSPGEEYEDLRDAVIADLERWREPSVGNGSHIVKKAWKREELYHGDHVMEAPDIILELSLESGYSYNVLPSRTAGGSSVFRTLREDELLGSKGRGMNGSHRREGIYIFGGSPVGSEAKTGILAIWDPAVTVLDYMGVSIPPDMDGKNIVNFPGAGSNRTVLEDEDASMGPPTPLSAREQEEIARRLRSLGYLD